MDHLVRLLAALAPVAWTAAAAAYLFVFLRQDAGAERWAPRLAWTAAGVHVAAIAAQGLHGICPLLVAGSVVSGLGLSVGVIHLLLERRAGDRAIGVFPVATAALFAVAGAAFDPLRRPAVPLPESSTALHVTSAILGYAGVLLAALFGSLYLVQRHAMKHHRFGLFWERLPSLELLDAFSRRSLAAGVVFLTLAIGFGHVVRRNLEPGQSYWEPAVVGTNALWLLCAGVVLLRLTNRIRPATSAAASVALFVLAVANMLVVDIFSSEHRGL